jgi:hypothetical protein
LLCVSFAQSYPAPGNGRTYKAYLAKRRINSTDLRTQYLPFQKPLHPMNRFAHKHGRLEKTDAATKQGRHTLHSRYHS